jgi:hypothetical protein
MKIIIIATAFLMVGCAKEEVKAKDCGCDRVVRVIPGFDINLDGGGTYYKGGAVTINDCSGEQRTRDLGNYVSSPNTKIGDCIYN